MRITREIMELFSYAMRSGADVEIEAGAIRIEYPETEKGYDAAWDLHNMLPKYFKDRFVSCVLCATVYLKEK